MGVRLIWKNESGQTLIGSLVGIAIASIVMAALSATFSWIHKEFSVLDQKVEVMNLSGSITRGLLNPLRCNEIFSGAEILDPLPVGHDTDGIPLTIKLTDDITISEGAVIGSSIEAQKVRLMAAKDYGTDSLGQPVIIGDLRLHLTPAQKDRGSFKPLEFYGVALALDVASGQLTGCADMESGAPSGGGPTAGEVVGTVTAKLLMKFPFPVTEGCVTTGVGNCSPGCDGDATLVLRSSTVNMGMAIENPKWECVAN